MSPTRAAALATAGLLAILYCEAGFAERTVYKWVDEDGVVHFGEAAPNDVIAQELSLEVDQPAGGRPLASVRQEPVGAVENQRHNYIADARHAASRERCMSARQEYEMLGEQLPVYRTAAGQLRVRWSGDTYDGERTYLSEQERVRAENQALQDIVDYCSNPSDMDDQQLARDLWIESDLCESARAKLAAASRPSSRSADEYIAGLERQVEDYCGR